MAVAEAASRLAVLCSRLLMGGDMPQASSSFASLCDRLLEKVQSERKVCLSLMILLPLLSLLLAAAWGLLLPQLVFAPPAPSESPEPERAVAVSRSEPDRAAAEQPEPLLTPNPPADGKPPEMLLAHTPDSFVAAVRERLGCRTQLPRKVYCAYFRSGVPTVTRADLSANSAEHAAAVLGLCDSVLPLTLSTAEGPEAATPPRRGETKKYVLVSSAPPHHEVEMVVMPAGGEERDDGRGEGGEERRDEAKEAKDEGYSLCISSQVG
jgi:hypothetical protein